jgi:hypothetical protein
VNWHNALTFNKWKIFFSIIPFIFPLIQITLGIEGIFSYLPLGLIIFLDEPLMIMGYAETIIATPFESLLRYLGWWSNNGIFVAPDGPLLPGSFLVAIVYSLLLYCLFSVVSLIRQKNTN